jgi:hypothetical protein
VQKRGMPLVELDDRAEPHASLNLYHPGLHINLLIRPVGLVEQQPYHGR